MTNYDPNSLREQMKNLTPGQKAATAVGVIGTVASFVTGVGVGMTVDGTIKGCKWIGKKIGDLKKPTKVDPEVHKAKPVK